MATKKTVPPSVQKKPDFSGVPGEFIDASGLALRFGESKRKSPYDELLLKLQESKPGSVLKFGDVKALVSIRVRAKKLDILVESAELDGKLYVRIAEPKADPRTEHERRLAIVRKAIDVAPSNPVQVSSWIRANSGMDITGQQAEAILMQISRRGEAELRDGRWFPVVKKPNGNGANAER